MERSDNIRKKWFPVDVAILFLLVFLNLPSEGRLEFGRDFAALAEAGGFWARFFEQSLVHNPVSTLQASLAVALLLLYSLVAYGCLFPRSRDRARRVILGALVVLLLILPMTAEMSLRHLAGDRGHAHDGGVVQTEAAVRILLDGGNPYTVDYRQTPMADLDWGKGNPAIIHNPYFPLSFLAHVPGYVICKALFGWYDARLLYLLAYLVPFFLIRKWSASGERRTILAALWGLNPFLLPHMIEGRNDVVVLALLVGAVHTLLLGRIGRAALFFGAACAAKQFALLLLPFFLLYAGRDCQGWMETIRRGARRTLPALLPIALFVLPFLLIDPAAFVDDTYAFNVGLSEVSYPLGGTPGFGLAGLVNVFHLVQSRYHYFPFWIFQIPAVFMVGALLLRRQMKENTIAVAAVSFALFLFTFLLFSRIFHHNYFAILFLFLAVPPFAERLDREGGETEEI